MGSVYKDKYREHMTTPDYSSQAGEPNYEEITELRQSLPRRIFESFKRDPNLTSIPKGAIGSDRRVFDADNAAAATANAPLARTLKSRHLQMIAIGGSIGRFLYYPLLKITSNQSQALDFLSHLERPSKVVDLLPS